MNFLAEEQDKDETPHLQTIWEHLHAKTSSDIKTKIKVFVQSNILINFFAIDCDEFI